AALGEQLGELAQVLAFAAAPAAAVKTQHARKRALALRHGQVELHVLVAALAVDKVTLQADLALGLLGRRQEHRSQNERRDEAAQSFHQYTPARQERHRHRHRSSDGRFTLATYRGRSKRAVSRLLRSPWRVAKMASL